MQTIAPGMGEAAMGELELIIPHFWTSFDGISAGILQFL